MYTLVSLNKKRKFLKKKIYYNNKKRKIIRLKRYLKIDGILNIYSTLNNVLFTFSDLLGNTLYSYSCGQLKTLKKKGLKSKHFTRLEAVQYFSKFLSKKKIKNIFIKLNGVKLIKKTLIKGLKSSRLKVHKVYNITPVPHNGCKASKYRRL